MTSKESFVRLSGEMAIEVMVDDLVGLLVPPGEAQQHAHRQMSQKNHKALEVRHRMFQALEVLDRLGYQVTKKEG